MGRRDWSCHLTRRCFLAIALVLLAGGCGPAGVAAKSSTPAQPKNIIVLFADGVSASQFEIGWYTSHRLRKQPFATTDTVFKEGTLGLLTTHAQDTIATDSAAAGSAMSTGAQTKVGMSR